jgi:hypothetical protein
MTETEPNAAANTADWDFRENNMKFKLRAAGSLLLAGLLSAPAMATPYNFGGDVTFDVAPGSTIGVAGGIAYGTLNTFVASVPHLSINASACGGPCGISSTQSLSGTFSVTPGRIITSIQAGVNFGPSSTIMGTYGLSDMTWVVTGGSYTGSLPSASFGTHAYTGNYSVTGPSTGEAHSLNGYHSGPFHGTSYGLPYAINAATFALDISLYSEMGTNSGGGYFGPLGFSVSVQTAVAPPPPLSGGVPAPGALLLFGLGLFGLGATRRRKVAWTATRSAFGAANAPPVSSANSISVARLLPARGLRFSIETRIDSGVFSGSRW